MKRVVVATGLHEADIRPNVLLSEFKRLSVIDASNYFKDRSQFIEIDCPACDSPDKTPAFRKDSFLYNRCCECGSVFVSPRPSAAQLIDYYTNSAASNFRVTHFAKDTAQARREHLLRSLSNWLGRIVDETGNSEARDYVDMNTHLPAIFEEIRGLGLFDSLHSFKPLDALEDECAALGVEVIDAPVRGAGAVTSFEHLESQFSPFDYLSEAAGMLAHRGVCFFTTRTISGFDLQVLWDKTPYIFVPEHLNLLSVEGLRTLVVRVGLDLIELSTPGQLDLELVLHAADQDPAITLPSFVNYLLKQRGAEAHADFQAFLQKHRLSSHVRVAAARRED